MNNKLLLVTSITLLYRESQLPDSHENSSGLVRQLIATMKLPEVSLGLDREREILDGLRNTALTMCGDPKGHRYEINEILQRLKTNTLDDEALYQSLREGIATDLPLDILKRTCINLRRTLENHFREEKIHEIVNKAQYLLKFKRSEITDMARFIQEHVAALEPYQCDTQVIDPAIVSEVDVGDINSMTQHFGKIQDNANGEGILITGWQGVNRMLDGGFRRGEQWVVGALQHNYKSGFTRTIFKHLALYNKPYMLDPSKKPMLLHISFEDDMMLGLQFWYSSLYENETGQPADLTNKTKEELSEYVHQKLQVNGYAVRLLHVNPSLWTYRDICNKILQLEAEGYEIHACVLDYLLKIPTTGCTGNSNGEDVRNLYERLFNFMKPKGILMITPHQLSTEAKQRFRDGHQGFVKNLVGGGFYAGCKQIDQVVDGEILIHIEEANGRSYLTVQRGKHRKIVQTPKDHLYAVLPFQEVGGILDDLFKADSTCKKVGGGPIGSGYEIPFWEVA